MSLRWLSRKDRTVPIPELEYLQVPEIGGYYDPPQELYPRGRIVISVDVEGWQDHEEANLAHEWQHHVQFYRDGEFPNVPWETGAATYEEDIAIWLRQPHELEAVRMAVQRSEADELGRWWLSLIGIYAPRGRQRIAEGDPLGPTSRGLGSPFATSNEAEEIGR